MLTHPYVKQVYEETVRRNQTDREFLQAVYEVFDSLQPYVAQHPELEAHAILERIVEPDRMFSFRVAWTDDHGKVHVNRGYRCQFNASIGPYKGGLRFHPTVTPSVIKFLGFEQIFKNSLTGLPLGGAKGGSDFDPKGKSDMEVMRFCQSFMTELYRHIGADIDVPAGDIGVGSREIGYLFGHYKHLENRFTAGVLTGKGLQYGGSLTRKEATGYGLLYFVDEMMRCLRNNTLQNKRVIISGSGNVALYAAEKAIQLGATVVAMSDSQGYVYDPQGIRIAVMKQLKEVERSRICRYCEQVEGAVFHPGHRDIWQLPCDIALPCATQNELDLTDAESLIANGVSVVAEGANMPCTPEAIECFLSHGILFAPAKAANAGGVATSGLEMSQNSQRCSWTFEQVDTKLKQIMVNIFRSAYQASAECGAEGNLVVGANVAGFIKVAQAMLAEGIF